MNKTIGLTFRILAATAAVVGCQLHEPLAYLQAREIDKTETLLARRENAANPDSTPGYAAVNGLRLHYEIFPRAGHARDDGTPLFLPRRAASVPSRCFGRSCRRSTKAARSSAPFCRLTAGPPTSIGRHVTKPWPAMSPC
jgi:hypothetical protein